MTLEFSDKEINTLIEIIYFGNWLINAIRLPKERIVKYDNLFEKVKKEVEVKTNQKVSNDELYNELKGFIDFYQSSILFEEFSKQYSNHIYPARHSDFAKDKGKALRQFTANDVLRHTCEEELKTHGFSIVNISLPDISQKIEEEFQKSLKMLT